MPAPPFLPHPVKHHGFKELSLLSLPLSPHKSKKECCADRRMCGWGGGGRAWSAEVRIRATVCRRSLKPQPLTPKSQKPILGRKLDAQSQPQRMRQIRGCRGLGWSALFRGTSRSLESPPEARAV